MTAHTHTHTRYRIAMHTFVRSASKGTPLVAISYGISFDDDDDDDTTVHIAQHSTADVTARLTYA